MLSPREASFEGVALCCKDGIADAILLVCFKVSSFIFPKRMPFPDLNMKVGTTPNKQKGTRTFCRTFDYVLT
jgi:hypothetical protein